MKIIDVKWCLDGTIWAVCRWPGGHTSEELLGWSLIWYLMCDVSMEEITELPF